MALTLFRIAAGPLVALLVLGANEVTFIANDLAARFYFIAAALFALAALSDWADGALARRWNLVSPLGAALDHIADKVLVACALVALAHAGLPLDLLIAALVLIVRDLAIAGLREALPERAGDLAVSNLGKAKTAAILAGITLYILLRGLNLGPTPPETVAAGLAWASRTLIWAAALISLWSGAAYARAAVRP